MIQNKDVNPNAIPHLEAAKMMLDVWKFRQTHCWGLLQRYGLAAVTVSIFPYLMPSVPKSLGNTVLIFPVLGWLISLAVMWLFGAEYVRLSAFGKKVEQLLDPHYPPFPPQPGIRKIFEASIGWTTIYVVGIGFAVLSIINAFVLLNLARAA